VEPNGAQPLYSAVVLSRCSDAGYKLYARDILATPLEAQLVTVSSCRSSGTPRPGEGLVGLAWAFLHAGARNVVAALWNVNDKVAPKIMNAFYEDLAAGEAPVVALHRAKIGLIRESNRTNFHKPYYWAPFQIYIGKSR
jgi:CHAT domain-containing protein